MHVAELGPVAGFCEHANELLGPIEFPFTLVFVRDIHCVFHVAGSACLSRT